MGDIKWSEVVASTAVISTILQFLTGCLLCRKYIQRKSTGETSGFPFVCGFLSCSLWLFYSHVSNNTSIHVVNVIGAILFLLYTIIYYVFTISKSAVMRQLTLAMVVLVLCGLYIETRENISDAKEAVGILCCTVTVLFFAAPLSVLLHVVRVRNSESLPFPLIASSFVVSLQWLIYGILIDDTFVQVPNFLGCLLSGTQLSLFVIYPSKSYSSTAGGTGGPAYKLVDDSFTF